MLRLGADVDGLDAAARSLAGEARRLRGSVQSVDGVVQGLWWQGGDAERFRSSWSGPLRADARAALDALEDAAANLQRQADQQRRASDPADAGAGSAVEGDPHRTGSAGEDGTDGDRGSDHGANPGTTTVGKDVDLAGQPRRSVSSTAGVWVTDGTTGAYRVDTREDTTTAHGRQITRSRAYGRGEAVGSARDFDEASGQDEAPLRARVHLAETDVSTTAGYERAAHGSTGFAGGTADGQARILVGAEGTGTASLGIEDGKLTAGASGELFVGVKAEASGSYRTGALTARGTGSVMTGASLKTEAELGLGLDGVEVSGGGEVFAGAKADAGASLDIAGIGGGGHASANYGLGASLDADASFSIHKVGFKIDAGLTLGLGGDIGLELSVDPSEVAHSVTDLGSDAVHVGRKVLGALNPTSWWD